MISFEEFSLKCPNPLIILEKSSGIVSSCNDAARKKLGVDQGCMIRKILSKWETSKLCDTSLRNGEILYCSEPFEIYQVTVTNIDSNHQVISLAAVTDLVIENECSKVSFNIKDFLLIRINEHGLIESVGQRFEHVFGYSEPFEIMGKKIKSLLPTLDLKHPNEWSFTKGCHKKGSMIPLETLSFSIHNKYIIMVSYDQEMCLKADILLSFNSITDPIVLASPSGIIQSMNPATIKMFQLELIDIKGSNILQFIDCDSIPEMLERATTGTKEFLVTKNDGTTFPASIFYAYCCGRYFSLRITDITEKKAAEKKYLEGQAQVFHVEASIKAKTEFFACMSHELRTPMHGIIGMINMLFDTKLSDEQYDFLTVLKACSTNLLNLLNNILDFSKMEAKKLELDLHSFDLYSVCFAIIEMFYPLATSKGIELFLEFDTSVRIDTFGDAGRIRQILINLIGNAIKFTSKGYVKLSVYESGSNDISRDLVSFVITDTGVGICEEQKRNIFNNMYQTSVQTTKKYGGTGLGLSICSLLTDLMNGTLSVDGVLDKGSVFTLTLPLPIKSTKMVLDDLNTKFFECYKVAIVSESLSGFSLYTEIRGILKRTEFFDSLSSIISSDTSLDSETLLIIDTTDLKEIELIKHFCPSTSNHFADSGFGLNNRCHNDRCLLLHNFQNQAQAKWLQSLGFNHMMRKPISIAKIMFWIQSMSTSSNLKTLAKPVVQPPRKVIQLGKSFNEEEKQLLSRKRVLIAEDNPINQKIAISYLKKIGLKEIDVVCNGQQAVDSCIQQAYQFILMDFMMPILDGFSATREIRNIEQHKGNERIPAIIVALTANASDENRLAAIESGMQDFIGKPLDPSILVEILRFHLLP